MALNNPYTKSALLAVGVTGITEAVGAGGLGGLAGVMDDVALAGTNAASSMANLSSEVSGNTVHITQSIKNYGDYREAIYSLARVSNTLGQSYATINQNLTNLSTITRASKGDILSFYNDMTRNLAGLSAGSNQLKTVMQSTISEYGQQWAQAARTFMDMAQKWQPLLDSLTSTTGDMRSNLMMAFKTGGIEGAQMYTRLYESAHGYHVKTLDDIKRQRDMSMAATTELKNAELDLSAAFAPTRLALVRMGATQGRIGANAANVLTRVFLGGDAESGTLGGQAGLLAPLAVGLIGSKIAATLGPAVTHGIERFAQRVTVDSAGVYSRSAILSSVNPRLADRLEDATQTLQENSERIGQVSGALASAGINAFLLYQQASAMSYVRGYAGKPNGAMLAGSLVGGGLQGAFSGASVGAAFGGMGGPIGAGVGALIGLALAGVGATQGYEGGLAERAAARTVGNLSALFNNNAQENALTRAGQDPRLSELGRRASTLNTRLQDQQTKFNDMVKGASVYSGMSDADMQYSAEYLGGTSTSKNPFSGAFWRGSTFGFGEKVRRANDISKRTKSDYAAWFTKQYRKPPTDDDYAQAVGVYWLTPNQALWDLDNGGAWLQRVQGMFHTQQELADIQSEADVRSFWGSGTIDTALASGQKPTDVMAAFGRSMGQINKITQARQATGAAVGAIQSVTQLLSETGAANTAVLRSAAQALPLLHADTQNTYRIYVETRNQAGPNDLNTQKAFADYMAALLREQKTKMDTTYAFYTPTGLDAMVKSLSKTVELSKMLGEVWTKLQPKMEALANAQLKVAATSFHQLAAASGQLQTGALLERKNTAVEQLLPAISALIEANMPHPDANIERVSNYLDMVRQSREAVGILTPEDERQLDVQSYIAAHAQRIKLQQGYMGLLKLRAQGPLTPQMLADIRKIRNDIASRSVDGSDVDYGATGSGPAASIGVRVGANGNSASFPGGSSHTPTTRHRPSDYNFWQKAAIGIGAIPEALSGFVSGMRAAQGQGGWHPGVAIAGGLAGADIRLRQYAQQYGLGPASATAVGKPATGGPISTSGTGQMLARGSGGGSAVSGNMPAWLKNLKADVASGKLDVTDLDNILKNHGVDAEVMKRGESALYQGIIAENQGYGKILTVPKRKEQLLYEQNLAYQKQMAGIYPTSLGVQFGLTQQEYQNQVALGSDYRRAYNQLIAMGIPPDSPAAMKLLGQIQQTDVAGAQKKMEMYGGMSSQFEAMLDQYNYNTHEGDIDATAPSSADIAGMNIDRRIKGIYKYGGFGPGQTRFQWQYGKTFAEGMHPFLNDFSFKPLAAPGKRTMMPLEGLNFEQMLEGDQSAQAGQNGTITMFDSGVTRFDAAVNTFVYAIETHFGKGKGAVGMAVAGL